MQHLDEGMIHAWLDGQLPRDEAQSVEAHVAECRQCADAVAEARGLIAASSRILMSLDDVPREVAPKRSSFRDQNESTGTEVVAAVSGPSRAAQRAQRRWFGGASWAAAAAIVVAIGTVTIMRRGGSDMASVASERPTVTSTTPGPSADSVASPVVAMPAARPPAQAEKALGGDRSGARDARFAATPPSTPAPAAPAVTRSNEVGRIAPSGAVRERFEEPKRTEARRLVDSAARGVPTVARAQVSEQNAQSASANKPIDEFAKDAKKERQQRQPIVLRGQNGLARSVREDVKADTTSVDRSRQSADAASVAKQASAGVIRGRVTDANNTGLSGVLVRVVGTTTAATTNEAGEFTLGGLQGGSYRLNVRRIGYQDTDREVTVAVGQTLQTDVVLNPSTVSLSSVTVTGAAASTAVAPKDRNARAKAAAPAAKNAPAPSLEAAPGAPIPATQSKAVGCYELGITSITTSRTGFRQVPRRVALDTEIVPANADGVWYRARDLARAGAVPNGLWRPTGPDAVELEFTVGSRTARVRVAGPAGSMMRGTVEEIDRATATGEAGTVVAARRGCEG